MKTVGIIALIATAAYGAVVPRHAVSSLATRQDGDYLTIVNAVEAFNGLPARTRSTFLEEDAQARGDSQGGQLGNPVPPPLDNPSGRSAQLQSPGRLDSGPSTGPYTAFELAYYSWLCQAPDNPAVSGRCEEVFEYARVTPAEGTAFVDIMLDPGYTEVGCSYADDPNQADVNSPFQGVWVCNFRG